MADETNKKIYAFFGFVNNETNNSIECFETASNKWSLISIKN